jgi:hypothetical protein
MNKRDLTERDVSLVRKILTLPLAVAVAAYMLLSDLVGPILKPLIQRLARIDLFFWIRERLERLTPHQALVLLAVPFLILEPLKMLALIVIARGHVISGAALLLSLHGLSLLSTERLFSVVKPKLLKIGWFAKLWGWISYIRYSLINRVRSSWVWALVLRVRHGVVVAGGRFLGLLGKAR